MTTGDYFEQLNRALLDAGMGRPCIVLDMDRLDINLASIAGSLTGKLRIVTKSLPCLPLLDYLMQQTGSQKLMSFHLPFFPEFLAQFPDASILAGKAFPTLAINEFLAREPGQDNLNRVQWLIDSEARLEEMISLGEAHDVQLTINIEIDIGLHRGGFDELKALETIARRIINHPRLSLGGMMGYEAHVPYYPDPNAAFNRAMSIYQQCVDAITRYTDIDSLTLNSGGSTTWFRFEGEPIINDVSVGSAFVKPAAFSKLEQLSPALYIAAPVLRRTPVVSRKPVAEDQAVRFALYGGNWPGEIVFPPGVNISEHADPPNQNLVPNQGEYFGREDCGLAPGDFVFVCPMQSDAMFQFESLLLLRKGEIVDCWPTLPVKY